MQISREGQICYFRHKIKDYQSLDAFPRREKGNEKEKKKKKIAKERGGEGGRGPFLADPHDP